jgi:tetratricopeptide (TPR) repeat protein
MNGKRIVLNFSLILGLTLSTGCQDKAANKFDSLMEIGIVALQEERYDDDIVSFRKGLEEKPNNEEALQLLEEAEKKKSQAELSETHVDNTEEPSSTNDLNLDIKKDNKKFFVNEITLLMKKDEVIKLWGKPDSMENPDPNDDYYKEDYDEWLFLNYGDMKLTFYSNVLRVVDLRPEDSIVDDGWYKRLGEPDEVEDNYSTFLSEEQFLSFSDDEPHMQGRN